MCVREFLPTGTVTLLLVDVEGSARLWETQPEEMAAALVRLDRAVPEIVTAHDGVGGRTGPDSSGADGFVAASRTQPMLWHVLWSCSGRRWRPSGYASACIPARSSWAEDRAGDYVGPTPSRAARLRDLAHGGQVWCRAPRAIWSSTSCRPTPG